MNGWRDDVPAATDAIRSEARQIAEMVTRGRERSALQVPGSSWSVADTTAHLVCAHRLYRDLVLGAGASPFTGRDDFFTQGRPSSPVNARVLSDFTERDPDRLATLVVNETEALAQAIAAHPADQPVPWHWTHLDRMSFACAVLFHAVGHVYDVGRALGTRYRVDPAHAHLALHGMQAIIPLFVDREAARSLQARIEIRVRGGSRFTVEIDRGDVSVVPVPSGRVACRLSADPVALLLVALGRESQWREIARAKLVAYGRRPWLALRLTTLFPSPG